MAYSNKEIAMHYFVTTEVPETYQCVCGQLRKQATKTGYGNLVSHVKTNHKDYEYQIQRKIRAGAGSILSSSMTSLEISSVGLNGSLKVIIHSWIIFSYAHCSIAHLY